MSCRRFYRFAMLAVFVALAAGLASLAQDTSHRGRKYKAPPPTSRIDVTILRNDDGKPIENAAVIFHLGGDKGNMELKTNEDGKTVIDVLPTGSKVLLQVIAKGFQTYGGDYNVDKTDMTIQVKLKRPGQQYSIYDNHPEAAAAGKAPKASKDAGAKDASKDDSSASSKQPDSKPDASQPQPQ
jgi:hypothetical protein